VTIDLCGWVPLEGLMLDRARVLVPGVAALLVSFPLCIAAWRDTGFRYPWLLWCMGNVASAVNVWESDGMTCVVLLYTTFAVQSIWIACLGQHVHTLFFARPLALAAATR
jgi:hypothetical protein